MPPRLISDQIEPSLVPDIEVLPWRNTHVVAVIVHPSQNRPHHLRREGIEKGTYVCVGSTNRHADPEAIDFRAASESFAPVRKLFRALLSDGAGHSTAEIAGHIGRTPRATRTRLAALTERGFVCEVGTGPHDPQRRYYLTGKP